MRRVKSLILTVGLSVPFAAIALGQQASHDDRAVTSPGNDVQGQGVDSDRAQTRNLYVWYRGKGLSRWHGAGPYNYDEAFVVERAYIRQGYQTYIGGPNG